MADQTAQQLTGSLQAWTGFLTTAARLYKYPYSKKFKAEHEADILLHQAAKKHFDALGLQKLPTVKALNAEYAALLAEKKAAYGDYRQAKEEMRELLTARANIDRILGKEPEARNAQKEKETEQR